MIAYASDAVCVAQDFLKILNDAILFPLITLLLAVAFIWFLYGGMKFIWSANNPTERENGRQHMLYGIIGLVVMTSAGAILAITANSFGLSPTGPECVIDPTSGPDGIPADF